MKNYILPFAVLLCFSCGDDRYTWKGNQRLADQIKGEWQIARISHTFNDSVNDQYDLGTMTFHACNLKEENLCFGSMQLDSVFRNIDYQVTNWQDEDSYNLITITIEGNEEGLPLGPGTYDIFSLNDNTMVFGSSRSVSNNDGGYDQVAFEVHLAKANSN
jgi:hypothetical protein